MLLATKPYRTQEPNWPRDGSHILAHYDDRSIVVYQAYRPSIAEYAAHHGKLGGPNFSYARMSWIKPNFLWMMYRSGWATKPDQESVLGLRISRDFFDSLLSKAVRSSFNPACHESRKAWQAEVARSDVRLQWDPDHHPRGAKQERRAIQLGLRGKTLEDFGQRQLLEVIDMSEFVAQQRGFATGDLVRLSMPVERVYWPATTEAAKNVGLTRQPDRDGTQTQE